MKKIGIILFNWEIDLIHDLGFGFNFETKSYSTDDKNKLLNIKVDDVTYKILVLL